MAHYYFAYGSNLWIQQMERRCPSAQLLGTARLPEHRLTFFGACSGWGGGGVADGEPSPGQTLEGVVYRLSEPDLIALDDHEDNYHRVRQEVELTSGWMEVWTYRKARDEGFTPPAVRYLSAISFGYGQHGFDLATLWQAAGVAPEPHSR
ncbi:MAG: gamma-glutamylcyclotransferase family protein [Myxococcota bacterium]